MSKYHGHDVSIGTLIYEWLHGNDEQITKAMAEPVQQKPPGISAPKKPAGVNTRTQIGKDEEERIVKAAAQPALQEPLGISAPKKLAEVGALIQIKDAEKWMAKIMAQPAIQKPTDANTPEKIAEVNAQIQIGLDPGLILKSQTMHADGATVRLSTGNITTGAPG